MYGFCVPCPFGREPTWGIIVDEYKDKSKLPAFPPETRCLAFHDWIGNLLSGLRRLHTGYFQFLQRENVNFREVPIQDVFSLPNENSLAIMAEQGVKSDSNTVVVFEEPRFVYGPRIAYRNHLPDAHLVRPPCLQVFWKKSNQMKLRGSQRYIHYWMPGEREETIWIYDTIDELILNLDNKPNTVNLLDIVLLTP